MAREIIHIPAKPKRRGEAAQAESLIRVAAYCRVSSEREEQLNSFENQVTYYTDYINNNPKYEMAGIYADEGISGTNTKKREDFNRMIVDCEAGKIDLVITKSISRFARNTQDCLNYSRMLKGMGIGITFEKEGINTLDSTGELLFTILSSLAQDESRSISENSKWGIQSLFAQGKWSINTNNFYGYDKDENGQLIINKEQGKVVKWMFESFINGINPDTMARTLNKEKIPTITGKYNWNTSTIKKMLQNEKHMGDVILQKYYTPDFLTHKCAVNEGQLPKYHIKEDHEPIVDKELWEAVQLELKRRNEYMEEHKLLTMGQNTDIHPFSHKVICGCCNHNYLRRTRSHSWGKVIEWECGHKYITNGEKQCRESLTIYEKELFAGFMKSWNRILKSRDKYKEKWDRMLEKGDALQKVRAKQFIEITDGMEPVKEIDYLLVNKVLDHCIQYDSGITEFRFLDGSIIKVFTQGRRL